MNCGIFNSACLDSCEMDSSTCETMPTNAPLIFSSVLNEIGHNMRALASVAKVDFNLEIDLNLNSLNLTFLKMIEL